MKFIIILILLLIAPKVTIAQISIEMPNKMGYVTLPSGFEFWAEGDKKVSYANGLSPVFLVELRGFQSNVKHPPLSDALLEHMSSKVLMNIHANNPEMYITEMKVSGLNGKEIAIFQFEGAKLQNGDSYSIRSLEIFHSNGFIGMDFYFLKENDEVLVNGFIDTVAQSLR